jgi:hypothetical protein
MSYNDAAQSWIVGASAESGNAIRLKVETEGIGSGNAGIIIGRSDNYSGSALSGYVDFKTAQNSTASTRSVRLLATGGTSGVKDSGQLQIRASSVLFTGVAYSDTAWLTGGKANNWTLVQAGYNDWGYRMYPDGTVGIRGFLQRTTASAASNATIATLPSGYRPSNRMVFTVYSNVGTTNSIRMDVLTTGVVSTTSSVAVGEWFSLDGIRFDTV